MSKIDFFRVLTKSIGLYFILTISLTYFPVIFGNIVFGFEWISILGILGGFGFLFLVYLFLILKTDQIINLLKLNEGFENEKFDLGDMTTQSLFQFAIVLVGLVLMFSVLSDIISFIQYELNKLDNEINAYLIGAIIKFVAAAILVVKNKNIASFLLK